MAILWQANLFLGSNTVFISWALKQISHMFKNIRQRQNKTDYTTKNNTETEYFKRLNGITYYINAYFMLRSEFIFKKIRLSL